jgi:regulator of sigma E protease
MGGVLYTIVILLVVLGILVFIHELGHYWAAKMFGVWVHRFAVGIGPPVKRLSFRRGETEWAVAWLPLGGYVKMASREEDPSSGVLEGGAENAAVPPDRMFEAKPVWQRMVIILAGVTLNMAFAWLVFVGLALANGNLYDPTTTVGSIRGEALPEQARALEAIPTGTRIVAINGRPVESWDDVVRGITTGDSDPIIIEFASRPAVRVPLHGDQLVERAELANALVPLHPAVIGTVSPGNPADRAGLQPGDSLVAIDGQPVGQWADAVRLIEAAPERSIAIGVVRDGAPVTVSATPRAERAVEGDTGSRMVGRIGVGVRPPYVQVRYTLGGAIGAGTQATWVAAGTILRTVRGLLTRRIDSREVGGPILIGQLAAQSAQVGLGALLAFMALISVNLAVVNLLPIPVLDGGAFLMLSVEAVIRRPIPVRLREAVQMVGLVLIVLLMVLAFSNDIGRLLGR